MTPTFALFYSQYDWLIVALIVLVLFGGAKIPQLAKGLGEGIREFKKSVIPEDEEAAKAAKAEEAAKAAKAEEAAKVKAEV